MRCINYAHRGASSYAPENTFAAFYLGLEMGADGIETDIQRTSDGVLVLFHDDSMQRICGVSRRISEYTYRELLQMDFGAYMRIDRYMPERVVTLEEFLRFFGGKQLSLALEIKQAGVEQDALELVKRFELQDKTIFTSFMWESISAIRSMDKDIALGYLVSGGITGDELDMLEQHGVRQICPKIELIESEDVQMAHERGFSVRTWKVTDLDLMKKAIRIGTDGMTINFPDKLAEALKNVGSCVQASK